MGNQLRLGVHGRREIVNVSDGNKPLNHFCGGTLLGEGRQRTPDSFAARINNKSGANRFSDSCIMPAFASHFARSIDCVVVDFIGTPLPLISEGLASS